MRHPEYYLKLSSSKLNRTFCKACANGDFEEVKYILGNIELESKINIHRNEDVAFAWALFGNRVDIIKYLIFDYKIDLTDSIKKHLNEEMVSEEVKKIFETQTLCEYLRENLVENQHKMSKTKL